MWDAIAQQGRLRYRDEQGELELPFPRLPGRHQAMNAALAVAMLRHQELSRPASALTAAMGWAIGRRAFNILHLARSSGIAKSGSTAAHNPSAARQIALFGRHQFDDGKPLHLVFASLATKDPRGHARAVQGGAAQFTRCRSPIMAASRRATWSRSRAGSASRRAHDNVAQALAAVPDDARVLIFGSLYLAGAVLEANDQLPD